MNNAVGYAWQTVEDMTHAVFDYMRVMKWEQCPEKLSEHVSRGGWYSSEVMAHAMNTTSMKKAGKVEYKLGLEPLHKNPDRIYSPSVIGAIVNKQNVHWVAIRFIVGKLFLLDSQRGRPIVMSERDYRYFVKKHDYAYCLELADDMSLPSGAVESGSTAAPHASASPLLPFAAADSSGDASVTVAAFELADVELVDAQMDVAELVEDSAMDGGDEDPNPLEDDFPLNEAHMDDELVEDSVMDGGEDPPHDDFPLNAAAVALAVAEQIGAEDAKRARE